ncbi:SGNH/GDSL hydrolase family protein [Kitasatospora aureofaciens]|uniref:SGNH/GDSL hydrolase family protein n=1 Tax=Kitasatospora aureofaciens TaxID=1894 RepID=UPI001C49495F|nr:SGNH/GDSL hydrolase family protein [Kitasatospora aureofaciens]MBV6696808.1 SGNH/GDSL hydrolase family protein [Kitasatospora aureofaciens]
MPFRAAATRLSAVAVATGTAAALALTGATPASAANLSYVALGDSYSAASGNFPLDPSAPLLCARSTKNYAHVIAGRIGARLTDVSCGGAQTKDFAGSQYLGVAPQLDAVGPGTDVVTMTIGGNDNNTFISSILACGSLGVLTAGYGSPCKDVYGSTFDDAIESKTRPAVEAALRAVKNKAPRAKVAILGYPWIVPATADPSCYPKMPVASGDVPYLRALQGHLNRVVQQEAAATGAVFVDMATASEGHDACAPIGTRWIEPLLFSTSLALVHPNPLGESKMADRTMAALHLR